MTSRHQHRPSRRPSEARDFVGSAHPETLGWRAIERRKQTGLWQDLDGDFLGLVRIQGSSRLPRLCDEKAVMRHCRLLAESMESRLVEAAVLNGHAVMFICRRLENWALVFTGILMVPTPKGSWVWSMVAKGRSVGDLHYLCEDCMCPAHPLARVREELPKLVTVRLDA